MADAIPSLRAATVGRVLPFGVALIFLAVVPLTETDLWPLAATPDANWLYLFKVIAMAAALWLLRRYYTELAPPFRFAMTRAQWAAALAIGALVFVLWINLDAPWMQLGHPEPGLVPVDPYSEKLEWHWIAVRVLGAVVLVPLAEELFWRSFLLRWIDNPRFVDVSPAAISARAVVIGAALFGLSHSLWLPGAIAGLGYSVLYIRTQNLWAPIVAHGLTNALLAAWVVYTRQWQYW